VTKANDQQQATAMLAFEDIGRIPAPGDNVAIATRKLQAGTRYTLGGTAYSLSSELLEGQRFAIAPIAAGDALLSWGLPFGHALRDIGPGEYLCNDGILQALGLRRLDFKLPASANFRDYLQEHVLDEQQFKPGQQVDRYVETGSFEGFLRPGGRGVGTRNHVVILATSSLAASFARALEKRLGDLNRRHANMDRIVAVTHTEGGESGQPNNLELVLRTLAGFMVHPNVAAVLALDRGQEAVNNRLLRSYMLQHRYPLDQVLHRFYSIAGDFRAALAECAGIVTEWLAPAAAMRRSKQPLAELRVALQCGGSDAFSGISGNPLAGWVAREVIRHGGAAALAETTELVGAEPYILANVRDAATAQAFLDRIAAFKRLAGWHGHTAEGNPTGGNKFRGLYNIALKSIGAARKKAPDVRLDHVIDYGQKMAAPGFYFMDSPGNDLESIAGQVAAGCNLILFITGNGSITNFPFVPTIKFVTTSARWRLLSRDMDVNAGRYQDGESMEELGRETFALSVDVASGRETAGERAGHSQVSLWRDWRQVDGSRWRGLLERPDPDGNPITVRSASLPATHCRLLPARRGFAAEQVGLIVPTSLCSGQIARVVADRLNAGSLPEARGISRFVALPHSEGCGASGGENQQHFLRTLIGHLQHPFVREAMLLEHGCEITHNDLIRRELALSGLDPQRFGYASIQLDGGIERVTARIESWFERARRGEQPAARQHAGLEEITLAISAFGNLPGVAATAFAQIAAGVCCAGGTVVIPANASLLDAPAFMQTLGWNTAPAPSLAYGQFPHQRGLHLMAAPTRHAVETLTGLGGTGAQLVLAHVEQTPLQGHPMIPLLQLTSRGLPAEKFATDVDAVLDPGGQDVWAMAANILALACAAASAEYQPRARATGNLDCQFTRGLLGVSL
jgi:altronate dehydratase